MLIFKNEELNIKDRQKLRNKNNDLSESELSTYFKCLFEKVEVIKGLVNRMYDEMDAYINDGDCEYNNSLKMDAEYLIDLFNDDDYEYFE